MKALRWLLMLVPLAITACHYQVTGPILFAHQSSSAFDMWLGLWVVNAIFFVWLWLILSASK